MASISFTCPNCAKVLRTADRPAPGRKIKCPGCDEIFVPEFEDEEIVAEKPAQKRTRIQAKTKAEPSVDEDAKSLREKAPALEDDEDEQEDEKPRRKKARARDDDDEDEDDADDRKAKKSKGKKKKAGGLALTLLIVFGVTFAVLGCVLFGVGAWVWPGFLIGTTNNNEITAYYPANTNTILVVDTQTLRQKNQVDGVISFIEVWRDKPNTKLPPEVQELMRDSDKVVVCSQNHGMVAQDLIAILAKDSAAVAKFKQSAALAGNEERFEKRHPFYRAAKKNGAWPAFVAIPGDRLVLLYDTAEGTLFSLLQRGDKPDGVEPPALQFKKPVEQSSLWAAFSFDGKMRQELQMKSMALLGMPGMKEPAEAVQRAKGGSWSAEKVDNGNWKVAFNFECLSAADAASVKTGGPIFRDTLIQGAALMGPAGIPGFPPGLVKDIKGLTFKTQDAIATLNIELSPQTLTESADMQAKQAKLGRKKF